MRLCSKRESKREVDAAIHAKEDALNQWVFSTMIHMSGIFEGGAKTPAGFFFPSVLATVMNLEVPELLLCVGETLLPIFGGIMVYRYPDFPVVLAAKAGRTNLLTAIQDEAEVPLSQRFTRQVPVMAFCALKNPDQTAYNYHQMIGARADRSRTLGKEVGTVEWSHGASDPKNGRALFVPWKVQEMTDLIKEYEDRVRRNVRRGQRFTHYKLTAPTDLTQQTLRTMRPKHGMIDNLVECCQFGLPIVRGGPSFQLWHENRQIHTQRLMKAGVLPKIELPKVENPEILGGQCSVSLLETLSRKPESVVKLPPEVLNLLEGYGTAKLGEWIQRTLNRGAAKVSATKAEDKKRARSDMSPPPPPPPPPGKIVEEVQERPEEAMSTGGESATEVNAAGTEPPVPMDMIPTESGTMNLPEPMNLPELNEPTVLESSPLNLPEQDDAVVDPESFLMNLPEPMNVTAREEAPSEVVAEEDDHIELESRLIEIEDVMMDTPEHS